jgi:hypothetical protein
MSTIEQKLWMDLMREPGAARALGARQPPAALRRPRRPQLLAGGAALTAAILAAVLTLKAGSGTTPAYAVAVNPDGSVSLKLNEVLGVRGANEALSRLGVRARVAQIETGCTQTGEIDRPHPPELLVEPRKRGGKGFAGIDLVIRADAIPRGDTLLITAQLDGPVNYHGKAISSVSSTWGLYRGAAPTCRAPIEHHAR